MSSGRIYVVILFFWALLIIVTPTLVRLSSSANRLDFMGELGREEVKLLLARRALHVAAAPAPAPAGRPGDIMIGIEPEKVQHAPFLQWN
ncbi:hypothetical protein ACS0TY_025606 [Phlomoides rotata]